MTDEELKELLGDIPLRRRASAEPPAETPEQSDPPESAAEAPDEPPAEQDESPAEEPFSADIDGIFDDPPRHIPEEQLVYPPEAGWQEAPEAAEMLPPDEAPYADDPFAETMAAAAAKPEKRQAWPVVLVTAACLLMIGFALFCIIWDVMHGTTAGGGYRAGSVIEVSLTQHDKPVIDEAAAGADGRYSAAGVAKIVMPSIAEIYTYQNGKVLGSGSGIVLTEDGFLATNAHVVKDASSYSVRLFDDANSNRSYDAELVGHDSKTDLAVLKISATGLKPAQLGDSDQVQLGETVCALGNPAGLSGSITTGIISGVNRKVRAKSTNFEMDCFQTDAAISPGNSGGALVNLFGQVIGITSSKYSTSLIMGTSYEGLGFAITINEALPILSELMEKGYVSGRVRIGIRFLDNSNAHENAKVNNVVLPSGLDGIGVQIILIEEDSDLRKTLLREGDWILTVNGKEVHDYDTLNRAIEGVDAGESVHCRCGRVQEDGTLKTFEIDFRLLEDQSGEY